MRRGLLALILLAAGMQAPRAHAFRNVLIDGNGPGEAWGKAVGDIDGDGRKDLVVGGFDPRHPGLYWYRNPRWSKAVIDARVRIGTDIEVADLSRDGRADVAAIFYERGRYGLVWYENTPAGWRRHVVDANRMLHDIEVKDLDGDGRPDVVGRGWGAGGRALHVWRRTAAGGWAHSRIGLPEGGEGLLAVDLDRDRRPDLAVGKYWLENVSRPGAVAFRRHTYNLAAPANAYMAAGTIDGDGRVDLVVSPAERAGQYYRVSWFQAPADPRAGTWTEHVIENRVECVVHFAGIADFDRDGHDDVATAMMQQGRNPKIKIYYNRRGDGTFGPPTIVAHTSSHSMRIIDVRNNGWPSLFGADWNRSPRTPVRMWEQP
ncbi:FG-GAP repeat domain-containing protein [Benzoatithermus flavus]|uniref:VCBS repeat-containing protein n=1 Tax=Benzoatithermus flavus TaxID=3108223 RepID=A0ABU8XQU5_9PROT